MKAIIAALFVIEIVLIGLIYTVIYNVPSSTVVGSEKEFISIQGDN